MTNRIRFIALIAMLAVLCCFVPSLAGAAGVTETAFHDYYPNTKTYNTAADNGWAMTGYGSVTLDSSVPTATDKAYTRYYFGHGSGYPLGYVWVTVEIDDPEVVSVNTGSSSHADGGKSLDVQFTMGPKKGTTKVTIEYTVTQLKVLTGIA